MEAEPSQAQVLRQLEERLLQPHVRTSAQAVAELLADEFVEVGRGPGPCYGRPGGD